MHENSLCIQGITTAGHAFRPSDWAERLAGVMSPFRSPSNMVGGAAAHLGYSPWCEPCIIGDTRCLIIDPQMRLHHPMAWDFVMGFARDNQLQTSSVCVLESTTQ